MIEAKYETCPDCRSTVPLLPQEHFAREYSPAWEEGDREATGFFVYILKLSDGTFYVGQTRELPERLMEHKHGRTKSTAGKDPKLVWFERFETRDQVTEVEAILKQICKISPREIRRMIVDMRQLIDLLDYS
ncbi:MAG: GIY-YIG nuclease family protein [Chloroflexota bacterium]|nr:GIY-YIG nuclease family protein [Chloroflexota bacterium]MDE2900891.1 GIY-YIG nuclease family protein [Chloroflexota bacterium]